MLFDIFGKQYLYKYTNDCYKNAIGDMQNEKGFYGHNNVIEYNHDYVIFL